MESSPFDRYPSMTVPLSDLPAYLRDHPPLHMRQAGGVAVLGYASRADLRAAQASCGGLSHLNTLPNTLTRPA